MRKFARIKTRQEVLAQCRAQRVKVDQRRYQAGSDWTTLRKEGCTVIWCSFNGNFFGTTPDGVRFSNESIEHESEPWFQQLLEFFYAGDPPAAPKVRAESLARRGNLAPAMGDHRNPRRSVA